MDHTRSDSSETRNEATPAVQGKTIPFSDQTNSANLNLRKSEAENLIGNEPNSKYNFTVKAARRPAPPPPTSSLTDNPVENSLALKSESAESNENRVTARPTHRHTSSNSSMHAQISAPSYPIRSQPIGLIRSNSVQNSPASPTISGGLTRKLGYSSASEDDDDDAHEQTQSSTVRPLKHRSDSLPTFPPAETAETKKIAASQAMKRELAQLPPNPKLWLPSHLSLYLANHLSLHPIMAQDITNFIRASRLSGRTFLRLRDVDFEEMGININWRSTLTEARESLRKEALGGRVLWGFKGGRWANESAESTDDGSTATETTFKPNLSRRGSMEVEGSELEEETTKEAWKHSWKTLMNSKGGKRVKNLASAFESVQELPSRENSPANSPQNSRAKRASRIFSTGSMNWGTSHARNDSIESTTSSAASIDSASGKNVTQFQTPTDSEADLPASHFSTPSINTHTQSDTNESTPAVPSAVINRSPPKNYQSKISAQARPYGLVRRPSTRMTSPDTLSPNIGHEDENTNKRLTIMNLQEWENGIETAGENEILNEPTLKISQENRTRVAELFGLNVPHTSNQPTAYDDDEIVPFNVLSERVKKGSIVFVKKSQLEALSKRMDEVEHAIEKGAGSERFAASCFGGTDLDELENRLERLKLNLEQVNREPTSNAGDSTRLSNWVNENLSSATSADSMTWTALSSYVILASVGIGIVAGEVVANRLFGFRRR